MKITFTNGVEITWKKMTFFNDAFQSYYDPLQANWLAQN